MGPSAARRHNCRSVDQSTKTKREGRLGSGLRKWDESVRDRFFGGLLLVGVRAICCRLGRIRLREDGEIDLSQVAGHDRDCRNGDEVFHVFTGAKLALDKDRIGFLEAAGGLSQVIPAFHAEPVGRLLLLFTLRPGLVDGDAEARNMFAAGKLSVDGILSEVAFDLNEVLHCDSPCVCSRPVRDILPEGRGTSELPRAPGVRGACQEEKFLEGDPE